MQINTETAFAAKSTDFDTDFAEKLNRSPLGSVLGNLAIVQFLSVK